MKGQQDEMKRGQDVRAKKQAGMGWEPGEMKEEHVEARTRTSKLKPRWSRRSTHTEPITA